MNPWNNLRDQYPILHRGDSRPLIYLDSAATALKPQPVIDAVVEVLTHKTANVHRAVHHLGDLATAAYEDSRQRVARFIGAEAHEIVFLRNTTEALNLVARNWPNPRSTLVSVGEHHSNILPWHGNVRRLPPRADGLLDLPAMERELARGDVGLVSVSQLSNVLGCNVDIAKLSELCHAHQAVLVVDAAQSVPHEPVDVFELDCDFLVFSGHKLGAPTGVGVLYGRAEHLERIAWHQQGGGTVDEVHAERVVPKDAPWRFEAGTPAIEAVVGLGAAVQFLQTLGMEQVAAHQRWLVGHALERIASCLPHMKILGPIDVPRSGPIAMVQRSVSPHGLARGLSDGAGICVRSGFHCAQPLHEFLGVPASLRLSFHVYNTTQEIDQAIEALGRLLALNS